jgi:hypothetical protein
VSDPDGEAAKALRTVAERLVGLGPRRIAHPELKIV